MAPSSAAYLARNLVLHRPTGMLPKDDAGSVLGNNFISTRALLSHGLRDFVRKIIGTFFFQPGDDVGVILIFAVLAKLVICFDACHFNLKSHDSPYLFFHKVLRQRFQLVMTVRFVTINKPLEYRIGFIIICGQPWLSIYVNTLIIPCWHVDVVVPGGRDISMSSMKNDKYFRVH